MRIEASRELSALLTDLETNDEQLFAHFWLAEAYGGEVLSVKDGEAKGEGESVAEWERPLPEGRRYAQEVVRFLKERGAKFVQGNKVSAGEDHWAAANSGDESELKGLHEE